MEAKYLATIDFTSLQALKTFIGMVNAAGGSVIINDAKPDLSPMLDDPFLVSGTKAEDIFISEIKIYASTTKDLARAKECLSCEIDNTVQKSASSSLLESVSNFKGFASRRQ